MNATRAALADAALALSAIAGGKPLRRAQRQFAGAAWRQVNALLGGNDDAPPTSLAAYAVALGLAEGETRADLVRATLLAAIAECRAAGLSRDDIAGLLSRAYLSTSHQTPQRECHHG